MQTMRSLTDAVKELREQKTGSPDLPVDRSAKKPPKTRDDEDSGFNDFDDDGPESDLEKRP